MDIDGLLSRLASLVDRHMERFEERRGYPPGDNEIVLASGLGGGSALVEEFGPDIVPDDVLAFFDRVERVALPDFWNGYFLGPVSWTVSVHQEAMPRRIMRSGAAVDVVAVGSDGGGTMYGLVPSEQHAVYSMPPDLLDCGVYIPTEFGAWGFGREARDFTDFLVRFVVGLEQHVETGTAGPFHH
jgi:hypothetical protein